MSDGNRDRKYLGVTGERSTLDAGRAGTGRTTRSLSSLQSSSLPQPASAETQAAVAVQAQALELATRRDEADVFGWGQRRDRGEAARPATDEVVPVAARGVSGAATGLPHQAAIQAAFGPHDVSGIGAHVGGEAAVSARAIGANAYAMGDQIAFGAAPDLFLAAHEAAHVVQQRQGVQLSGGVGQAGDRYEHHADAVAHRVVAGQSAEHLLGSVAADPGIRATPSDSSSDGVQRQEIEPAEVPAEGATAPAETVATPAAPAQAPVTGVPDLDVGLPASELVLDDAGVVAALDAIRHRGVPFSPAWVLALQQPDALDVPPAHRTGVFNRATVQRLAVFQGAHPACGNQAARLSAETLAALTGAFSSLATLTPDADLALPSDAAGATVNLPDTDPRDELVRTEGDDGQPLFDDWDDYAGHFKAGSFLGRAVNGHEYFLARLEVAASYLRQRFPGQDDASIGAAVGIREDHGTLQDRNHGLGPHCLGLAIDVNVTTNPYMLGDQTELASNEMGERILEHVGRCFGRDQFTPAGAFALANRRTRPRRSSLVAQEPSLRAAAGGMCRGRTADLDDLIQDTFERALRHLTAGRPAPDNLRAWLMSILRNLFVDRCRAARFRGEPVEDLPAPTPMQEPAWARVGLADVLGALAQLDPEIRIAFQLHYLEGLPYSTIAARLGLPANTVASRLFRARRALRAVLIADQGLEIAA